MPNRATERSDTRYGAMAQAFHWLTAVLVLVAFLYGPGGSETRVYGSQADFDRRFHETLGLMVFAIVLLRLLWRLIDARPEPPPVSRWMGFASRAVQGALYLMLFAVPLSAVAGAWLEGHPLTLFFDVRVPPLTSPCHDLGVRVATLHTWLGDAILWLAGLHALAAIAHHIVLRDGVLSSMLPAWFPLPRSGQRTRP